MHLEATSWPHLGVSSAAGSSGGTQLWASNKDGRIRRAGNDFSGLDAVGSGARVCAVWDVQQGARRTCTLQASHGLA